MIANSQPQSVAQEIVAVLEAEIHDGAIQEDSPVPTERELCQRFGASRPTVHEALIHLQTRGFIHSGNGKRPVVARPSVQQIIQEVNDRLCSLLGDTQTSAYLEQMRQFIETGAAREAAHHATSVQIAAIKIALDTCGETIGKPAFVDADIAFHEQLVAILDNPVISAVHGLFTAEVIKLRPPADNRRLADQKTFEEHTTIFRAILDGDAELATELLDQHLIRSFRKRLVGHESG